jgi:hypothetical protein
MSATNRILTDYIGYIRILAIETINVACVQTSVEVRNGTCSVIPTTELIVTTALNSVERTQKTDDTAKVMVPADVITRLIDAINTIKFDINVRYSKRTGEQPMCTIEASFSG